MNNLAKILLGGAAISALVVFPAAAGRKHPALSFTAWHAGHVVNKTKLHNHGAIHVTYTYGVYTYASPELHKKVPLAGTFYKWNNNGTICSQTKDKVTFPKKTAYGKLSLATETVSLGCPSGPTKYDGVDLKFTGGGGGNDTFAVIHQGIFKNANGKYKGTLNLDVTLSIE